MKPDEARRIVAGGRNQATTLPQHPHPDTRRADELVYEHERRRFEYRLAKAAIKRSDERGEWPDQRWFNGHRSKFYPTISYLIDNQRRVSGDPPCKHWREKLGKVDQSILRIMDTIWSASLLPWARQHMYLASPTAPCQCNACGRQPRAIADYDWNQPLGYPNEP